MKKIIKRGLAGIMALILVLYLPADVMKMEARESGDTQTQEIATEETVTETTEELPIEELLTEETTQELITQEEVMEETMEETTEETVTEQITTEEIATEETAEEETVEEESLSGELIDDKAVDFNQKEYNCEFNITVTDNGELDYRTYYSSSVRPQLKMDIESMCVELIPLYGDIFSGNENIYNVKLTDDEKRDFVYTLEISGTDVICPIGIEESKDGVYTTHSDVVLFDIKSVGTAHINISAKGSKIYNVGFTELDISVKNSPLYDEDFFIELNQSKYNYNQWISYLREHNNWANGDININLSDIGGKYYDCIGTSVEDGTLGNGINQYTFWAENSGTSASTKSVGKGTRSFEAGIDKDAPKIKELIKVTECYEPTKTETEQYFAEDFILKGSFVDLESGVSRIEYTTDFNGDNTKWKEIARADIGVDNSELGFEVILGDGCYNAVGLRAFDIAGNVSGVEGFVNEDGEYIKVIVDRSEPVIGVGVTSGDMAYSGDNENWTNKDVVYDINFDTSSCPYAGLYQYEYTYQKIGENNLKENKMSVDIAGKTLDRLVIKEDKNGFYYFQAVSKSGVKMKEEIKNRILLQHQIAEIKPVIESGADDTKKKNDWYNSESKTPIISFEYPEYDAGSTSKEYDAPVELHYVLTGKTQDTEDEPDKVISEKTAVIGVMGGQDVTDFVLTKDDIDKLSIDFGYDSETGYADDGIYTLEYWLTDAAGNESERQHYFYKIDCHEPDELKMTVADLDMPIDSGDLIAYDRFYNEAVSAGATAQYGISGKNYIKVLKARKIGQWNGGADDGFEEGESFNIDPNIRCFLYVKAEDNAGNVTQGWTKGIVVDNMAPVGKSTKELIVEPVGANKNGFFNDDVKVQISIKDEPGEENCAALMNVSSSVGHDGEDTLSNSELFSFTKEMPTDEELNEASAFETVQVIDAKANESNEAYIEVTATDRSENMASSMQLIKIDVTEPEIEIDFDNNNAVNGRFYNQSRTATIHVHELNFDENAVDMEITKNGVSVDMPVSGWKNDKSDHYATVTFLEDGDYTLDVSCTDLADNESEKISADGFTIDCTLPVVDMELKPGIENKSDNDKYFSADVTAVITVTEHNFNESDFVLNVSPIVLSGVWSHNGDVHTMNLTFNRDNDYSVSCAYSDMAGNRADDRELLREFTIDRTVPLVSIDGVADGSANSGEVTPVITVLDLNMEPADVSVEVTTGLGQAVENVMENAVIADGSGVGYRFTLSDMTNKEDNIYYLSVMAHDKAGNEESLTYRFSLNRNGSAYDFTEIRGLIDRQYIRYADLEDIHVVEMNIDNVSEFDVYISRNADVAYRAKYDKNVKGSENTGYTYTYTISRNNFKEEGNYRISLYSKDRAGNEVNNFSRLIGSEILFVVDNTVPKVIIDGDESGDLYNVTDEGASVVVSDNFKLSEAEITLVNRDNDVLRSWDYMELAGEGETLYIDIPENTDKAVLLYRVKDAAGNEMQIFQQEKTPLENFIKATEKLVSFVQEPQNHPAGMKIVFAVVFMAAVAGVIMLSGKYRNKA